ncbi:PAS domain-containing protein [Paenibacillus sp. M1]|uniref:PAS domain-containing protein n=1 Tax=Paenibacillus haidiansis TaxID=1574488 RepID=A0ABU7VW23_9BACL
MTDTLSIWQEAAQALPKGLAIVDAEGTIQFVNRTWARQASRHSLLWGHPGMNVIRHFMNGTHRHKPYIQELIARFKAILEGRSRYDAFEFFTEDREKRWYLMEASSLSGEKSSYSGILLTSSDITSYKENENQLQEALSEIRTLRGLLPICAVCKKIKDENEDWSSIEEYLTKHTHAEFTHDICPDCIRLLYPKYSSFLDSPDKPAKE